MMRSLETCLPKITDHEAFGRTINQLNRNVTRGCLSIAAGVLTLLATPATLFVVKRKFAGDELAVFLVLTGVIVFALLCNAYGLLQYQELKQIRDKLNEQLRFSIKQHKRAEKLYGLSILDPLTGLHNRRFGEERLTEEIGLAEKSGDPLAVLILDLDYFKGMNDEFGHAAGDAALKEFSRRLRKAVRACDTAVRIGGDEFLVILPDCPRENVNVILSRLGSPQVIVNSQKLPIRYSVGRSQLQATDTIKTILKRADEALYTAKRARSMNSLEPTLAPESLGLPIYN
jgi:diguanylate cyclase (GGDEF)-like protein